MTVAVLSISPPFVEPIGEVDFFCRDVRQIQPDLARWLVNLAELAWQGIPYQFT